MQVRKANRARSRFGARPLRAPGGQRLYHGGEGAPLLSQAVCQEAQHAQSMPHALSVLQSSNPDRHIDERGEPRVPEDLLRHTCLKYVLPSGLERSWTFAKAGVLSTLKVAGSFKADHGEPLLAAAVAGLGLVQAPDILIADELARGELVEVLSSHAAPGPALTALCAPGRQRSSKVRAFVEVLRTLCASDLAPRPRARALRSVANAHVHLRRRESVELLKQWKVGAHRAQQVGKLAAGLRGQD